MKRWIVLFLLVGLLYAPHAWAQTPTVVQYLSSGRDNTQVTGANAKTWFPNKTLSGNCLAISMEHDSGMTVSAMQTDKGDTLTLGPTVTNNAQTLATYRGIATAGSQVITATTSGGSGTVSFRGVELYNSDCTSDVSNTSATRSVTLTTTVSGDYLYHAAVDVTTLTPTITSMATSSGGTVLSANRSGTFAQYKVTGSSGSQTTSFTTSDSDTWESTAIALKPASTGTAPSSTGIRVIGLQGEAFGTTTHTMQVPCAGNLLVGVWSSAAVTLSALSSSPSNTWSTGQSVTNAGGPDIGQIFYSSNATCSNTLTLSPTYSGTDTLGFNFLVMVDVTGAATSAHDVDSTTTGTQNTVGSLVTQSITPTTSNGLVFNAAIWFSCTVTGASPGIYAGAATNSGNNNACPAGSGASTLNEDDGRALYYNPNTSAVSFTYTNTSNGTTGVGVYASVSSAFKAALASATGKGIIF
jgi:hypothetical protein